MGARTGGGDGADCCAGVAGPGNTQTAATRAVMLHTTARLSNEVWILARRGCTCKAANRFLFGLRRRSSGPGRKPITASTANTRALSGNATVRAGEYCVPQLAT